MNSRSLLASLAAAAACLAGVRASPPASRPASSSPVAAEVIPADLAGCIQAIRAAGDSRAAMAAYARGCSIERNSLQLQEAYMLAMLRLGRPSTAAFPARALLTIKADHPMAWAVVGYNEAKRKRLVKAIGPTFRAAAKLTDGPSVLHNAGQLLAWYENQSQPPNISDAAIRSIQKSKDVLGKKKPFAEGRKAIQVQYDNRKKIRDLHKVKIDAAKGEANEILTTGKGIDRAVADMNVEIKRRRETIVDLRGQYRRLKDHPERDLAGTRRALLNLKITHERQAVKDLEDKIAAAGVRGKQVLGQLRRKLAEVKKLERTLAHELSKRPVRFRWDPPAVDGVVTPEVTLSTPSSTAPAGTGDQTGEARLRIAKLYLKNKMPEKAAAILNEIIINHPTSSAAAEAKAILAKLKPAKK